MWMRIGRALVGAVAGYLAGAVLGYALITWLSTNTHDRDVEAAMTAAFAAGPLGALIGLVLGALRRPGSAS